MMTRDEIMNMPAGREMDALIAKVCGWVVDDLTAFSPTGSANSRTAHGDDDWLEYYSTDCTSAWKAIEALENDPDEYLTDILRISEDGTKAGLVWSVRIRALGNDRYIFSSAETAPLAICRAALFAVMGGA